MGRYLGIDYGKKRIGLSCSDDRGRIAFPFRTIENRGMAKSATAIVAVIKKEHVFFIVLGLPTSLSGEETEQSDLTHAFAEVLKREVTIPVEFANEILTTKIARAAPGAGRTVDAAAAAIMLQGYLDSMQK